MADPHNRDSLLRGVTAAIRAATKRLLPDSIEAHHRFINDLGFDSMSVALLALSLEDEFDQPILLHTWVSRHTDPSELTVGSLCAYLEEILADERPSVHG